MSMRNTMTPFIRYKLKQPKGRAEKTTSPLGRNCTLQVLLAVIVAFLLGFMTCFVAAHAEEQPARNRNNSRKAVLGQWD